MSAVWVSTAEAARGSLPARCAGSGQPCLTRYRWFASPVPAAVEWLTWTGPWPLDRRLTRVPVVMPLLPSRHRLVGVLRTARDLSAAALPLAAVLAVAGVSGAGRLAGLALVVHLLVAAVGVVAVPAVQLDRTGRWVRVSQIHRELARATEARTDRPATPPAAPTLEELVRSLQRPTVGRPG